MTMRGTLRGITIIAIIVLLVVWFVARIQGIPYPDGPRVLVFGLVVFTVGIEAICETIVLAAERLAPPRTSPPPMYVIQDEETREEPEEEEARDVYTPPIPR